MAAIPERVWELLTDDERENLRQIAEGWRYDPRVECPSCGCQIAVRLRVTAGAVRISEDGSVVKPEPQPVEPVGSSFDAKAAREASEDVAFLLEAERSGVLAAFIEALRESNNAQDKANDLSAVFLHWFKLAKPTIVPQFALTAAKERFGGYIEFFASNGVVVIVADGALKQFMPQRLITGTRVRTLGGSGHRRIVAEEQAVEWVRGRFGYVPADAPLFNAAMRQKSPGNFGRIVQ